MANPERGVGAQTSYPVDSACIALSATFTADPLLPVIGFWQERLNTRFDVRLTPYNQIHQTLLDPGSEFARNTRGANVVLLRIEDLGQFASGSIEAALSRIEANVDDLVHEIEQQQPGFRVPLICVLCPPSDAFLARPGHAEFEASTSASMGRKLESFRGIHVLTADSIERLYPVAERNTPEGERLGRIPYSDTYFAALGTAIVRRLHGVLAKPRKVIALDCDNTLWQGICGEDGPEGVALDAPRRALQMFMREQRDAGMLLVMASKNNEQDVLDTFEAHPEMPLQLEHFAGWRLNWDSKPENLAGLAEELDLGLDSFIFIDDNPKECAEVENGAPEVLPLALPKNISDTADFLAHVWAFDHPVITDEDRKRNILYAQKRAYDAELRSSGSLEDFLRELELRVEFAPVSSANIERVAQLTRRTNQFNFTSIRRTVSEVESLASEGFECYAASVSDRFGDYGLVGVMVAAPAGDAFEIDTMLLSCRALGRGVEHRMLAYLADRAAALGLRRIRARVQSTSKNAPARRFLESIAGDNLVRDDFGMQADLDASYLRSLTWTPASTARTSAASAAAPKSVSTGADYGCIARELRSPAQIVAAMRAGYHKTAASVNFSETEGRVAAIWSELLERPVNSIDDNFFDLGGHSLLAVLMILRVKEAFGIELPVDDVYSADLTLGGIAGKIELYQLTRMNPDEVGGLLAEVESLSDEEVQALLEKHDRV